MFEFLKTLKEHFDPKDITFEKISWDEFESLFAGVHQLDEIEYKGETILIHRDKQQKVDAVFYHSKNFGSKCLDTTFKSPLEFVKTDTNRDWS